MYGINVIFENGRTESYTSGLLDLLKSDKYVSVIIDAKTGKILYRR